MKGLVRVRSLEWFAAGVVVALMVTMIVTQAWRVDAAPGDTDATFVAITPCRLADTRPAPERVGPNQAFGAKDTKTFAATGTNGQCTGIPTDAVGVSLNVTALGASAQTFLTFWPGGTMPLAASLNPAPGQPPVPNAVTTSLSGGGFNVFNDAGSVNVVIDINGYYTRTSLQKLASDIAAIQAQQPPDASVGARLDALEASATGVGTRLTTLEGQNAGTRLTTLEASATGLGTRVTTLEASATGLGTRVTALEGQNAATRLTTLEGQNAATRLTALENAEPFVMTTYDAGDNLNTSDAGPRTIVTVSLTAPVAGQVTVTSTTRVSSATATMLIQCSISTGTALGTEYLQEWESPGSTGDISQLAGTRVFDIPAQSTVTYKLLCKATGPGLFGAAQDAVLSAIFTPTNT